MILRLIRIELCVKLCQKFASKTVIPMSLKSTRLTFLCNFYGVSFVVKKLSDD